MDTYTSHQEGESEERAYVRLTLEPGVVYSTNAYDPSDNPRSEELRAESGYYRDSSGTLKVKLPR